MTRTPLPGSPNRLDPIPGSRAIDEQMMAMIVSLASETTILRARLDACERLLVAANVLVPGGVDTFEPDAAAQAERDALRQRSMAKIFRPLQEAAQADLQSLSEPAEPDAMEMRA